MGMGMGASIPTRLAELESVFFQVWAFVNDNLVPIAHPIEGLPYNILLAHRASACTASAVFGWLAFCGVCLWHI